MRVEPFHPAEASHLSREPGRVVQRQQTSHSVPEFLAQRRRQRLAPARPGSPVPRPSRTTNAYGSGIANTFSTSISVSRSGGRSWIRGRSFRGTGARSINPESSHHINRPRASERMCATDWSLRWSARSRVLDAYERLMVIQGTRASTLTRARRVRNGRHGERGTVPCTGSLAAMGARRPQDRSPGASPSPCGQLPRSRSVRLRRRLRHRKRCRRPPRYRLFVAPRIRLNSGSEATRRLQR